MKRLNSTSVLPLNSINTDVSNKKQLFNYSEEDILSLQDSFLTAGVHYIKVSDLSSGRHILTTVLQSLNYYSQIAFFSETTIKSHLNINNLYQELDSAGIFNSKGVTPKDNMLLEEFILNSFYYDFLAIEATSSLLISPLYREFERLLVKLNFTDTLPVVIFTYDK